MTPTLDARLYVDPATYAAERTQVFARSWQLVAASAQLPDPGDALAVTVAGWPLVVVRATDGSLRGFHNVCRHRAGPLVWDGTTERRCRTLRCKYHGWQYDLDGRLVKSPGYGTAPDPAHGQLFHVAAAEWRGLVFLHLGGDDAPALEGWLGDLADAPIDLTGLHVDRTASHPLACNWKTYVENYLEGYHIPYLHKGLSREVDIEHYRVRCGTRHVTHEVPTRDGSTAEGFWAWLWPNVALNVYRDSMSLERIVPTGPESMRIDYVYLARDVSDATAEARAAQQAMSHEVTLEDIAICEAVQRNLAAGAYRAGELSPRHEGGVAFFQQLVRSHLDG